MCLSLYFRGVWLIEVEQIFHLTCIDFKRVVTLQTIKTNVIGTLNMLGLAKRVGARL